MATLAPLLSARPREPALTAVVCFASGILVDHYVGGAPAHWGWAGVTCLFFWIIFKHRGEGRAARLFVAGLLLASGGARHHLFWSTRPGCSITALSRVPQPVRLHAVVVSPITIRNRNRPGVPAWLRLDYSTLEVECQSLTTSGQTAIDVRGLVKVDVAGHLVGLMPQDRVEILGQLVVPDPPRNPGDFDYPAFLRAQGIDRIVHCDHPDAVQLIERPRSVRARLARVRETVRQECGQLLIDHIPSEQRPVAASLLTGDRSEMPEEIEDAFIRSGTMHILAISGLHIGALAGFTFWVCRLLRMRSTGVTIVVLSVIYGYASLIESRPSVMRAVMLATFVVIGRVHGRSSNGIQALSLTALVLLLLNPADLFDIGAQLSFVAVAAIIVVTPWVTARTRESLTERLLAGERSGLTRCVLWAGSWLASGYVITIAVWLATIPITMRTFHLVSPAGLVVNALLTPYSTLVMCAGFVFLGVGLLCPPLAAWVAIPFRESLQLFLNAVEWSSRLPGGSGESPVPDIGWMAGFYLLLLSGLLFHRIRYRQWMWRGTLVWTLGWLMMTAWPRDAGPGLICTFLDVGHGGAILVSCPNGRTLLYDVGSMSNGRRAAQAVQAQLRQHGTGRVDALVISHADADHYNGGVDLVSRTPIGTALFSQHCLDFEQQGVPELFDQFAKQGTELRMIQAGDRLLIDPNIEVEVLHPSPGVSEEDDNANSVVIRIRYAGRDILLTGDLEKGGAASVQKRPIDPVDVLLAPHHGGKSANTPRLAEWARPRHVIASSSMDVIPAMTKVYDQAETIHCTAVSGAVRVQILPDGQLTITVHNQSRNELTHENMGN